MAFNLFQLHDGEKNIDRHRSWIRAKGTKLTELLEELITEIKNSNYMKKNDIIKLLGEKLKAPYTSFSQSFNYCKRKGWFPLVLLENLLNLWKELLNKTDSQAKEKKDEMLDAIEQLRVGVPCSKVVKIPKELNKTLCWISGAHAADGFITVKYRIGLVEGDRKALNQYCNWIVECFGVLPSVYKFKKEEAWCAEFKSKVIARFLTKFLNFPVGEKSNIVKIPKVIRNSSLNLNYEFCRAFITFDGCIQIDSI